MVKIAAIAVVVVAIVAGAAAGQFLRPAPSENEIEQAAEVSPVGGRDPGEDSVVTLDDAFIVPILRDGLVWSHVVLSLGVTSEAVSREDILVREPLLRDAFTETLFLHGSLGGFDGDFTLPQSMKRLRERLDDAVARRLDDPFARVLIVSVARQGA